MAIANSTVWEARSSGSALNGGGFHTDSPLPTTAAPTLALLPGGGKIPRGQTVHVACGWVDGTYTYTSIGPAASILTGQPTSPEAFERRFVGRESVDPGLLGRMLGIEPGEVETLRNVDRVRRELAGRVDYHPGRGPAGVSVEEVRRAVPHSDEQRLMQRAMLKGLPSGTLWKLQQDFPLSRRELRNLSSFLAGPRQVGLSTYRYGAALAAFDRSPTPWPASGSGSHTPGPRRSSSRTSRPRG